MGCENRIYCIPACMKDGTKMRITEVIGDIECSGNEKVVLVRLG
jgi:uncharacterized protein (UPF0179 family)